MPENLEDLVPPEVQPAAVDEGKVRRKSMLDGMWKGMKRGLLWGGVAGVGLTTLGTVLAYSVGGMALKAGAGAAASAPAWLLTIAKIPKIGPILATAIGGGAALIGANLASNLSIGGMALGVLSTFGGVALPVLGGALAVGALIGGTWGAISGYMESDNKIQAEHRKVAQTAAQLNFERKRVMQEILQQREMEAKFDQQTKELYAGNSPEIGHFSSPTTPAQTTQEKGQDPTQRGWS